MIDLETDIAVMGAGFGGSLAALLARQIGRRVVLIDRGRHPRFAIGESSTPLANLVLEELSRRYDLAWLAPFANYSSWKQAHPDVVCGLKRGFSYFHHRCGEPLLPSPDHAGELLVAASYGPDDADTHWLRSDFDAFLATRAELAGIPCFEQTELIDGETDGTTWQLAGTVSTSHGDEPIRIQARFVVDATGERGFLPRVLQLSDRRHTLHTHSRALFAHFRHVAKWEPLFAAAGGRTGEHPFPCDDAALHHVFDGGWMYVLRFDNGVTSAGFCLDPRRFPLDLTLSPEDEWRLWLSRLPAVQQQFSNAEVVSDGGRFRRTGRMQRRLAPAAGPNWALLPNAMGFIDPLHSTGNAHTLMGLERLATAWDQHWDEQELVGAMAEYDRLVQAELAFIDAIVAGSYAGFADFPRMVALSLFYFTTAIWSEHERRAGRPPKAFLCADDRRWTGALSEALASVREPAVTTALLLDAVRKAIAPFDLAGLGNPALNGMIAYPKP